MKIIIFDDNLVDDSDPKIFERKSNGASCVDVKMTQQSTFSTSFEAGYRLVVDIPDKYLIVKSVSHNNGEVFIFVQKKEGTK